MNTYDYYYYYKYNYLQIRVYTEMLYSIDTGSPTLPYNYKGVIR